MISSSAACIFIVTEIRFQFFVTRQAPTITCTSLHLTQSLRVKAIGPCCRNTKTQSSSYNPRQSRSQR
ncbi:unnamed protein product [Ixodes persulcatus]